MNNKSGQSGGNLYTEEDWNTDSSAQTTDMLEGYMYSKVAAERAAWDICKQEGINLITILPGFVLGPVTSTRPDATSTEVFQAIWEGTSDVMLLSLCDVRDVCRAHVLAAELDSAAGRYLVAQTYNVSSRDITDVLAKRFPQYAIKAGKAAPKEEVLDNSKVRKELGMTLTPWEESVIDMAVTLIQVGIAKPVPANA
eukprot:jgi/Chrzof1/1848/Cz10g23170.t1